MVSVNLVQASKDAQPDNVNKMAVQNVKRAISKMVKSVNLVGVPSRDVVSVKTLYSATSVQVISLRLHKKVPVNAMEMLNICSWIDKGHAPVTMVTSSQIMAVRLARSFSQAVTSAIQLIQIQTCHSMTVLI